MENYLLSPLFHAHGCPASLCHDSGISYTCNHSFSPCRHVPGPKRAPHTVFSCNCGAYDSHRAFLGSEASSHYGCLLRLSFFHAGNCHGIWNCRSIRSTDCRRSSRRPCRSLCHKDTEVLPSSYYRYCSLHHRLIFVSHSHQIYGRRSRESRLRQLAELACGHCYAHGGRRLQSFWKGNNQTGFYSYWNNNRLYNLNTLWNGKSIENRRFLLVLPTKVYAFRSQV